MDNSIYVTGMSTGKSMYNDGVVHTPYHAGLPHVHDPPSYHHVDPLTTYHNVDPLPTYHHVDPLQSCQHVDPLPSCRHVDPLPSIAHVHPVSSATHVHPVPIVPETVSIMPTQTVVRGPTFFERKYRGMTGKRVCLILLAIIVIIILIAIGIYYGSRGRGPPDPPPTERPVYADRDRNECADNNGMCEGRCINKRGGYECTCPSGHKLAANRHGCIVIDGCKDDPCMRGFCKDLTQGYKCECMPGYGGRHCEFELCDTDEGYVYYKGNGHCYKYYPVYVNWFQAEDHCQQTGGHLLSVNTDDERLFIDAYMNSMPHEVYDADEDTDMEFWMGLYMPSVSNPLTWHWSDKSQGRAVKWQEDEPDGGNREMCGRFERGNDFDHSTYTRDFADAYPCDPHTYVDESEPDDTFSNNPFLCELPSDGNKG